MYDSLEAEIEACPDQGIKMRVMGSFITAYVVRRPHYSKVQIWGERFLFVEASPQNSGIIASILCHVAWYYCCYRGDFNKAKLIFEGIYQIVTEYPLPPLQHLNMKMIEAAMYAIFGDTKQCSQIVSNALAFSKKSGVQLLDFMLIGHEIANALNRNDVPKAVKLLKILENWHRPIRLWDKSFFHFLKARTLLISKEFQEASLHAQISLDLEDQVGSAIGRSLSRMLFVQILFAQGKKSKAKILIEDLLKLSEKFKSESLSLYVLFIKAQFALSDGDVGLASECLHRGAQLAKSTGMVNTYVDQPEATAALCIFALKNQIEVEYFTHVIRFRQLVPSNPPVDLDNWPWPIKIHALGSFRIYRDGNALEFVRKVQQMPLKLLKLMVALGGTGIPEEQLADILWPDTDGYLAYRAFSTTLYRLRQLLEIPDLIKVTEGKVNIDKRLCWVDSWAFEKITNEILLSRKLEDTSCNRSEIQQKLEKALLFYQGDFLKMEEWGAPVISEREKLRGLFIQLIDKIGRSLEAKELWHEAIQLYKRGLVINESIEKFYQQLMICHFNLGEKSDAINVFERCRKIFLAGYGIEPGNKTNEIRSMIMRRSD
jgi:DNA-binding SARP family transcriptional activator